METAKVDIRKLQLLNDRINQTLDALQQVRYTVHGLSHSTGQFPGIQGGMFPGATQGFGGFGPQSYTQNPMMSQGYGSPFGGTWGGQNPTGPQQYGQQGFSHTTGVNPQFTGGGVNPQFTGGGANPLFTGGVNPLLMQHYAQLYGQVPFGAQGFPFGPQGLSHTGNINPLWQQHNPYLTGQGTIGQQNINPFINPILGQQNPMQQGLGGLSHTTPPDVLDIVSNRPLWADPIQATRVEHTFPFAQSPVPVNVPVF